MMAQVYFHAQGMYSCVLCMDEYVYILIRVCFIFADMCLCIAFNSYQLSLSIHKYEHIHTVQVYVLTNIVLNPICISYASVNPLSKYTY